MYELALVLSVFCFAAVGVAFVRMGSFSVFHPLTIYMGFHGLVFVFRPILAWLLDYRAIYLAYNFTPSPSDKLTVLLASNLGFLVFAFMCLRAGGTAMAFKVDAFTIAERNRLKAVLPAVLAICIPIGGYSLISIWIGASSGIGYEGMVRDKATGTFINTTGNGYLSDAQLLLGSCFAIVAWVYRFRLAALAPLGVFALMRAGTGGRGPFITALATVGLLYFYENRKKLPSAKLIAGILLLLAAFSAVGQDRGRAIRVAVGSDDTREYRATRGELSFMEGMDFGNLEFFEYVVYVVPQRSGTYDYFLENLQLFTEPIPRTLWKDKPIGAPIKRFNMFDYGFPIGMTRSLPGQGWFFLGWLGVIIWCGLWGYGLGWLYRKFVEGPQNTLQVAGYMILLPIMIIAYRDGSILTVFRQGLFFLLPVALWYGVARMRGIPSAQMLRGLAYRQWRNRKRAADAPGAPTEPGPSGPRRRIAERPVRRRGVVLRQPRFTP